MQEAYLKTLCLNCLKYSVGYKDKDGVIKMTCPYCGTKIESRTITRRHVEITMIAPKGQEAV